MTDLDRRVEELAARQHGVFSTRQVLLLNGNTKMIQHRVRKGRWKREQRGVLRLLGAPASRESSLMAFVVASDDRAVVSHRSAARSHKLPGYDRAVDEFTLLRPTRVGRATAAVVHETNCLPAHHRTRIDDIPTTTIARTLFDLTAVVPVGRAARAMDTALARRSTDYRRLLGILVDVSARGRRRTRVFRMLLSERGPLYRPPESELERHFEAFAARVGLSEWDRQVGLGDRWSWIGRVDFFHREARIVVEVDGREAHSALIDLDADAERDRRLTAAGFRVLRFGWAEIVHDPGDAAATIAAALDSATLRPKVPPPG